MERSDHMVDAMRYVFLSLKERKEAWFARPLWQRIIMGAWNFIRGKRNY